MIQIIQERQKCIGCGYCVEIAPDRWEMNAIDGKCNLIGATKKKGVFLINVPDFEFEVSREVADICPVNIIKIKRIK